MSGALNASAEDSLRTQKKNHKDSYGRKVWSTSPSFANAVYFQNHTKSKSLSCFNGTSRNIDGRELVEVRPFLVRDAITSRPIKGTNQILAQTILRQMEKDDRELTHEVGVLTFDECTRHGLYLKADSFFVTLTTAERRPDNIKVYNAYRYFPISALQPQSVPRLKAIQYTNSLDSKISYLRKKISIETDPKKREIDERRLSYAHMDKALGSVMFDKSCSKEVRVSEVQKYIDKLPENEKKNFKNEIMQTKLGAEGKIRDYRTAQGIVENFNSKIFIQTAQHEMEFIESQRNKKAPLQFDATKTKTQSVYLAKWLAASELAATNPNVTFLTDRESIESASKSLSRQIDKAFSENNHSEVFVIGNQASEQMKQELREFRQKEQSKSLGRANARAVPEQEVELGMDRSF